MTANLKIVGNTPKFPVGSKQWAAEVLEEARRLARDIDTNYMRLAEQIWLLYDTPMNGDRTHSSVIGFWKDPAGAIYTSFDKFAEHMIDIHRKKAQRLRNIWMTFKIELELEGEDLDKVIKLGFSKVRELARPGLLTKRNVEAWVAKADDMTCFKLMTTISQVMVDKKLNNETEKAERRFRRDGSEEEMASEDDEDEEGSTSAPESPAARKEREVKAVREADSDAHSFSCILFGDQYETVQLAIKRSKELSHSEKIGHNLSLICLDFIATNDFKFADETQRLRFVAKFEKLMGYKFVIIDPKGGEDGKGEVLYGLKALEKMARSE